MSRQVVIGGRADGTDGIFVAPPGVDALFATDDQLLLNISSKISQLLLFGSIDTSQTVVIGAGRAPFVLITGRMTMGGVPGYGDLTGPVRPSPNGVYGTSSSNFADLAGDGSFMYVTVAPGSRAAYAVYNAPFN